jgi:hypothetical protein
MRILLAVAAFVLGAGVGILVGRQYPAHHFERMGDSQFMVDTTTGTTCDLTKTLHPFSVSTNSAPPCPQ